MGENFDNAGLEEDENSDSTEDEVDSIVQSPSVAVRALEDDIDDAGLLRGMLQVSENSGEVEKSEFVWSFGWQLSLATIFKMLMNGHPFYRTLRRTSTAWPEPTRRKRSSAGSASPTRRTTLPPFGSTHASTCCLNELPTARCPLNLQRKSYQR